MGTINEDKKCSLFGMVVCVCDVPDCHCRFKTKGAIFEDIEINKFISYRGAMDHSYILLDYRFRWCSYASRDIAMLKLDVELVEDEPFYTKPRFPRDELHIVTQHP
jgi:hypothetical protein